VAAILLIAGALAFVVSGGALALKQNWWRTLTLLSAAISTFTYVLFWNGTFQSLPNQGAVGILINLAILGIALWGALGI
jgi:hypothetical protein